MDKLKENIRESQKTKKPSMFNVVYHNNDFTPMEFVIISLITYFGKNEKDAINLTMQIHKEGSSVVGTYVKDVAYLKMDQVKKFEKEALDQDLLQISIEKN